MLEIKDKYTYTLSKDNPEALIVENKSIVKFYALDCYTNTIKSENDELEELDTSNCNPATGPLFVKGAEAGDLLKVSILDIEVDKTGVVVNYPDCGAELENNEKKIRIFEITNNQIDFNGIKIDLQPMVGVIGTAPANGFSYTGHVFENGGNMDSRLNKKGAVIYLPVCVEGALLSIGDLHGVMGDGEMVGTGLEVGGIVTVQIEVIKNVKVNWPITEVDGYYYINTCGKTCNEAIANAYKELHRLLVKNYGFNVADAAMYISLQARLEASQACLSEEGGGNSFRIGVKKLEDKQLIK